MQPSSLTTLAVSEVAAEPIRCRVTARRRGLPADAICLRRAIRVSIACDHIDQHFAAEAAMMPPSPKRPVMHGQGIRAQLTFPLVENALKNVLSRL